MEELQLGFNEKKVVVICYIAIETTKTKYSMLLKYS